MPYKIFDYDPYLKGYEKHIDARMKNYEDKLAELTAEGSALCDFANGHEYFGFHKTKDGWYYREWAPAADEVYLTGDMVGWDWFALKLTPKANGIHEIFLPGENALYDGCLVKTIVKKDGKLLERIPLYIRYAVQDRSTGIWCGQITDTPAFKWHDEGFAPKKDGLLIYECHIGMCLEDERIGTYNEFREQMLPRIKALGYNTIQLMAIMEHPFYGSFGYQVSSFFAASSRYGTPDELKALIDEAHSMGLNVLLDLVHSHAVKNTLDGINEFDGTSYQFFHEGKRGHHPAWDTKLFDYGKNEVIHYLLSNLKFWLTEYHFDGFRFDGVTSMIYKDHGLGVSFTDYGKYFSDNTDLDALTYLQLANNLIRQVKPDAITVAEDMSGMPGMCLPIKDGGIGFDYRLAMGQPDLWIKLIKESSDENWNMWHIWHELTTRRPEEKCIGYAESHDQALVGDQTIMFRLCGSRMYTDMSIVSNDLIIERGMALHKLIRMVTMTLGGNGYLCFMGNEFGHPEWIDFPREGNGWSYFYCRRQWRLAYDKTLKYQYLLEFDKAMTKLISENALLNAEINCLSIDDNRKVIVYERSGLVFAVNFNPNESYEGYWITVPENGKYQTLLSSDNSVFGGFDRISLDYIYTAEQQKNGRYCLPIYLPSRCGLCLKKL